uniref:hypothetical protein n=1 Tax=Gelidibacter sp. TaxID=2018083 RepID=UPI0040495EA1
MENTNVDCNELLAKIVDKKLKEEGLISVSENQLVVKLAKGQLKDVDWKVAFEEIIYKPKVENVSNDETE